MRGPAPLPVGHRGQRWPFAPLRGFSGAFRGGFPLQIPQAVALVLLAPALLFGGSSLPLGDPRGLGRLLLLFQRAVLAVASRHVFLPLRVLAQQAHRLAAGQGVHLAGRFSVEVVAQAAGSVRQRQEIAGSPGVVGQHPPRQVGIDRLALRDEPFADVRVNVRLEGEDRVVVLGERLGQACHQEAMEGGGLFLGGGHGFAER